MQKSFPNLFIDLKISDISKSSLRFIGLFVFTFEFYFFYWIFKNYRQFKHYQTPPINPYKELALLIFFSLILPVTLVFISFKQNTLFAQGNISFQREIILNALFMGAPVFFLFLQLLFLDRVFERYGIHNIHPYKTTFIYAVLDVFILLMPEPLYWDPWGHRFFFLGILVFRILMGTILYSVEIKIQKFLEGRKEGTKETPKGSILENSILIFGVSFNLWHIVFAPIEPINFNSWFNYFFP